MAIRPGFRRVPQTDFAAGMFRGVARHLIPLNGVYTILNGLLDDDGSIYRRGGSRYHSNKVFDGAATGLTNLITNPSFEVDLTGWSTVGPTYWLNPGAVAARVTTQQRVGAASMRVVTTAAVEAQGAEFSLSLTSGLTYQYLVWVKGAVGGELLQMGIGSAAAGNIFQNFTATTEWQPFFLTLPATGTAAAQVAIRTQTAAAATFYVDTVLVVQSAVTKPEYFDGSLPMAQWNGAAHASTSTVLVGPGLRWLWDGQLAPGLRTLLATPTKFGVLDSDDATPINLGGTGLAGPVRGTTVGQMVFIDGGTIYGGSRKTADYSTGTVTATNGSKVITGAGTTWSTNVDAGMLLRVASNNRYYVVASVDSNTQITLTDFYGEATLGGQSYALKRLGTAAEHGRTASVYATIFGRLLTGEGDTLWESALVDPTTGAFRTHSFGANDNLKIPGGVTILGVDAVRDTVLIFTTGGVWSVVGMAFNLTDALGNVQQRVEPVNRDLILWGKEGLATYGNELVVPCVDGVYVMGAASGPKFVSRSIQGLYRSYVRAGHKPGLATVYRSHYILPILDAGNNVVDTLVCRLDRPVQTPFGDCVPWSQWDGHGGNIAALAVRAAPVSGTRSPELLAAGRATDSLILKLGGCFEPQSSNATDADGTTHVWEVELRDTTVDQGSLATVEKLRIRYELYDAASDNPRITGLYSKGEELAGLAKWDEVLWDAFVWAGDEGTQFTTLPGQAPEDTGRIPHVWRFAARTRLIRGRLRCTDPCASLVLRSSEWSVRAAGKDN